MTQNKDCVHELTYCRCDVGKGAKSGIPIASTSRVLRETERPDVIDIIEDEVEDVPEDSDSEPLEDTGVLSVPSLPKAEPAPSAASAERRCDESQPSASTPPVPQPSATPAADDSLPKANKRKNHKPTKADRSPLRQKEENNNAEEQNALFEEAANVEPQQAVVEMPPAVKCNVCSNEIQPTTEVYYMWRCLDQCAFFLHKSCLHEEMSTKQGFKKKREYKDAICATEGCSAPICSIHEFDMQNKETLYIKSEHEKMEKAENKKVEKLKHTLAKDQKKMLKKDAIVKKLRNERENGAADIGDSNNSSTRQSATPEEQIEDSVVHSEPVIFMPAISSVTMPHVAVEKPANSNPLIKEINEKAVPLMKKKDEVESKYSVTEQKTIFKQQKAKKKKEILDVFTARSNPNRLPGGGFDEYLLPPSASFSGNHVPDAWDDDRSATESTSILTDSQFSDTVPRIHDPQHFPDSIDGTATFPLPGTREGEEFMTLILDDIEPFLDDIAINSEAHQEGANRPVSGLLEVILMIADKLQPSQMQFLKVLFSGEDANPLRMFIQGLKYFTVAMSANGYTYCKNQKGRALHQRYLDERQSAMEALQQQQQAAEAIQQEEEQIAANPWSFANLRGNQQLQHDVMAQQPQQLWPEEEWQQLLVNDQPQDANGYNTYAYNEDHNEEQGYYYDEVPQEQLVEKPAVEFTAQNPPRILKRAVSEQRATPVTSSESYSGLLVEEVMSMALSGSQAEKERLEEQRKHEQRDKEQRKTEEMDKKISLKLAKMDLRARIKKEEKEKSSQAEQEGWSAEASSSVSQENAWGNGDNSVIPSFHRSRFSSAMPLSLNNNPSDNHRREIRGKENEPQLADRFTPPGFERRPLADLPQSVSLEQQENMVPQEKYLDAVKESKRKAVAMKEMEEKMAAMQMELEDSKQKLKTVQKEKDIVVSVCHEKDNRVRSLNTRLDEQKLVMDARVREAELQGMKAQAHWDLRSIESSVRHNGDIIRALVKCSSQSFEEVVEELSENHRSWEALEQIARKRLELLEEGILEVPVLPSPPVLSEKVVKFFQLSVDYSKHAYSAKLKEFFPRVKTQLEHYAGVAGKEMPPPNDLKSMLLLELQSQPVQQFDCVLAVRRLASGLGFCRFEDSLAGPSSNNSSFPPSTQPSSASSSQPSRAPSRGQSSSGRSTPVKPPPTAVGGAKKNKAPLRVNGNGAWGPSTSATDRNVDVAEVSCEICLDPMFANETLHACELCKEPFHRACVLAWLDKEATCPHCRGNMPHPGHFPELR